MPAGCARAAQPEHPAAWCALVVKTQAAELVLPAPQVSGFLPLLMFASRTCCPSSFAVHEDIDVDEPHILASQQIFVCNIPVRQPCLYSDPTLQKTLHAKTLHARYGRVLRLHALLVLV